jgi:uncharacterized protein GlcG (DUF336 family)
MRDDVPQSGDLLPLDRRSAVKGRVALLGLSGATPIEGGVPIMVGGRVVGGIGVSGATSDQDAAAAMAGLKAAGL